MGEVQGTKNHIKEEAQDTTDTVGEEYTTILEEDKI